MINLFKTTIRGIEYPLFVAAMASSENLQELNISIQLGITNKDFIAKCRNKLAVFLEKYEYTRENIELFFGIRFCYLRVVQKKIFSFEGVPHFGSKTVYLHKKYYSKLVSYSKLSLGNKQVNAKLSCLLKFLSII